MAANVIFSAMNYPSIMLYILAYIISLQTILESAKPKQQGVSDPNAKYIKKSTSA
jgi:hypothetical protein